MIIIISLVILVILGIMFENAPMGREDPQRGFIRTDEDGKDLE